ncbi:MAG: hypothetical protein PUI29_09260 [Aeromonadales bacterium]|nr:hypothetical protein [Aeromonadales bacterium]MDY2890574.1 hypothetical protein [Succinivibrio sp.]
MKVRCDIKGLDCAACAAKLEGIMQKKFNGANLNYAMGSLVLDVDDSEDEDEVASRANEIAASFEDGITVALRD